jgi:hypothetical protein
MRCKPLWEIDSGKLGLRFADSDMSSEVRIKLAEYKLN